MTADTDHYVYLYRDPRNNEPFYVGMGTGHRDKEHWTAVVRKTSERPRGQPLLQTPFYQRLIELRALRMQPIIERPYTELTEAEAATREKELIDRLGRARIGAGPLLNGSAGGESHSARHRPARNDWGETLARVASLAGKIKRPGGTGIHRVRGGHPFEVAFARIHLGVARSLDEAREMRRQAEQAFDFADCLEVA